MSASGLISLRKRKIPNFKALKRKRFSVVIPLSIAFLVWYFLYVILSTYAHDFMSTKVVGEINVGLVFGLLQFVTTFAIDDVLCLIRQQEARSSSAGDP